MKLVLSPRVLLALTLLTTPTALRADEPPLAPNAIVPELQRFRELGSVLYVAAHPDDENTQLIAYLARGKNYRTAYLSATRGDGGQNVLGSDFDEKLGVARTQELLAARKLDGGRQFFTRAIDFGFSKDYRETLNIWDKQQVIVDYLRIIRTFRPDAVIARFSPQPGGGNHGHHTASAVLAVEAFKLAGDPKAFPDQLAGLKPWQPKRLLLNGRGGGANDLRIEIGGTDPLSNVSLFELAGRSRAMHKTQGFDNYSGGGGTGTRTETFQLLDGEPATNGILDGVDTSWNRVPGGGEIDKLVEEIIAGFKPEKPDASVPAMLALRKKLAALPDDPIVNEKRERFDFIIQSCLRLQVRTTVREPEWIPGETLRVTQAAIVRSDAVPVRWIGLRVPWLNLDDTNEIPMEVNQSTTRRQMHMVIPVNTPFTHPYWLRDPHPRGMFRVADPNLIVQPENPPQFPFDYVFTVGDQTMVIRDYPGQVRGGNVDYVKRRPMDIIPPVSLQCLGDVKLFSPGSTNVVEIDVEGFRPRMNGDVRLETPLGWNVQPAFQNFLLTNANDHQRVSFTVIAPTNATTTKMIACARIAGRNYRQQRVEVNYPHIPLQLLHPPATFTALIVDLKTRGHAVGYVPGAGDSVAENLREMGYAVTELKDEDLTAEKLRPFDAIVIGVRAFNVRSNLAAHLPALADYVEAGGNVIAQYNRPARGSEGSGITVAPFPLKISGDRVTDENATMTFLAPDHPVLNVPNKITADDFLGWVQERGIYFANQWDEKFTPILACADPGEDPLKGSLLIAHHGKGYFVYTGLAFFRQLPAAVPGSYRLFANLVSLGKAEDPLKPEGTKP